MPESLLTILKVAFLALLWLFFLRVLRAVWAELKEPATAVAAAAPRGAVAPSRTTARTGPQAGAALKVLEPAESAGRTFGLGDDVTVGRGAGCGVALTDDRMVSQLHARIFRGPAGELLVEDLGSTNGTTLNRTKVNGPTRMNKGDRLQVGRTVLEVQA